MPFTIIVRHLPNESENEQTARNVAKSEPNNGISIIPNALKHSGFSIMPKIQRNILPETRYTTLRNRMSSVRPLVVVGLCFRTPFRRNIQIQILPIIAGGFAEFAVSRLILT